MRTAENWSPNRDDRGQLCTGVIESEATTLEKVIEETMLAKKSERQARAVDQDKEGSMEEKKQEGYF
jgi:sulfate adenylyltransferase subunit 2